MSPAAALRWDAICWLSDTPKFIIHGCGLQCLLVLKEIMQFKRGSSALNITMDSVHVCMEQWAVLNEAIMVPYAAQ